MAVAVGNFNVDLTKVALGERTVRVPISLGAGDLTVTVPRDTAVAGNIRLSAGDISWEVDQTQEISGVSGSHTYDFASNEVTQSANPELVLQIEQGAGKVRVVEGN